MSRKSVQNALNKKISIFWNQTNLDRSIWQFKFIKCLTKKGKKDFVRVSTLKAFSKLKSTTLLPSVYMFEALEKTRPVLILKLQKKGKFVYQIPTIIKKYRQYKVGMKWLVLGILRNSEFNLSKKIQSELYNIVNLKKSVVLERQKLLYKLATENRALTHYRWTE